MAASIAGRWHRRPVLLDLAVQRRSGGAEKFHGSSGTLSGVWGVSAWSLIVAVLAIVVSVWTYIGSGRRADAAAKAAERALAASERSAAAAETQTALAVAAAARRPVPWEIERNADNRISLLRNRSDVDPAYVVRVEASADHVRLHEPPVDELVSPRGAARLTVGIGLNSKGNPTAITVHWRWSADGPDETPWTHPVG